MPAFIREPAVQYNLDAGLDPLDSYGYRIMYRRWVDHQDEDEAMEWVTDHPNTPDRDWSK